jgi:hypothetical protein
MVTLGVTLLQVSIVLALPAAGLAYVLVAVVLRAFTYQDVLYIRDRFARRSTVSTA